jgi:hypothetical protein
MPLRHARLEPLVKVILDTSIYIVFFGASPRIAEKEPQFDIA